MSAPLDSLRKVCPACDQGIYASDPIVWDARHNEFVHAKPCGSDVAGDDLDRYLTDRGEVT